MSVKQETFMQEAIYLSLTKMEQGYGGPFGAVVVRNNEIIARGYNNVLHANDPTAHAEVEAIRKACQALGNADLSDCDLYTSCEPCPMCLGAIYWARFRKVYFANTHQDAAAIGFDDAFIYNELEKDPSERAIPMEQLMRTEAQEAFIAWDQKADKKGY